MIEPLRVSFEVNAPRDHAFDTWTTQIDSWWPKGHSFSGDEKLTVVLENRMGGRLYERTSDGQEFDWGEITVWEPRERFGYLWHIRRDRADATDVVVTFAAVDDARTRIDIEHFGWERLGAGGADWRAENQGGWSSMLPYYVAAVEDQSSTREEVRA